MCLNLAYADSMPGSLQECILDTYWGRIEAALWLLRVCIRVRLVCGKADLTERGTAGTESIGGCMHIIASMNAG